jgi:hypothetical protein
MTAAMKRHEELAVFIKNLVHFGKEAGEMDGKMVNSHVIQLIEIFEAYDG